jgi:transcription-repair coupling factor (superfamily II helicase)
VAYAHGRMNERELERIMVDFVDGEIDVLVSTTIIETGMDIPNVNTIIIHDSDRMGLSQLYQLRGRVGRSNRTAYAFLMYRRDRMLKETAEKRLHAIREYTELGSGVRIAMRDLEIRGAGNLLGAEQSGHMEAVGYDLYCKMLSEAVSEEKGGEPEESFETGVDLVLDAFIPDSYIPDESQKLDIYRRISAIGDEEDAENMTDELLDRYGDLPASVTSLISVAKLRSAAHSAYITEIKETPFEIRFTLYERARLDISGFSALLEPYRGEMKFYPHGQPCFVWHKPEKRMTGTKTIEVCSDFVGKLSALVTDRV